MKARAITERVSAPFTGSKVDREAGTISDVLVCGRESLNNRLYPWGGELKHKQGTYESAVVNCDHGDESTVGKRLGWLTNETTDADGRPRATLNVLKSHPMGNAILEAAERNPALFGLSHVAMCHTREDNGVEVVTAIEKIISVDVVATPATTKGFYESTNNPKAKKMTIKQLLEKIAAKASVDQLLSLKRLGEMDGYDVIDMEVPVEDPDQAIKGAFKAAMNSQVDAFVAGTLDFKTFIGKLKELAKASGKISGAEVDTEVVVTDPVDDDDMEESAKVKHAAAILEALDVVTKLNFKADKSDLEIIAAVPAASRESVAKRLQGTATNDTGSGAKSSTRQTESFNTNDQKAKTESTETVDLSAGWIA
jgi:hypothetical protein